MLSPKTEGEAPTKLQGLMDGPTGAKMQATDQKTEPGGAPYVGGDSTTDAQSAMGALEHDPSRLSNAFGAQH